MTVGIVGLGYVGLPLAVAFAEAGVTAIGVDVDAERVDALRAGRSLDRGRERRVLAAQAERHALRDRVRRAARGGRRARVRANAAHAQREPDLGPLLAASQALAAVLREGQLVVLESTSYPGTTREQLAPELERGPVSSRARDSSSPSLPSASTRAAATGASGNTPKIVGGLTPACGDRAEELYRAVCDEIVRVSSPEAAEFSKLLENIFRSVNIALVNELSILARPHGDRRLGGRRRRVDQAVRVHALRAGSRHGGPLPARRSLLPGVEGPRVRLPRGVRGAGGEDQPEPAVLLRAARDRGAQPRAARPSTARACSCSAWRTSRAWATCASHPPSS